MAMGMQRELRATYDEALGKVVDALKAEGFGVLTEVDVQSTLKNKIGVDFRRYKILGACNPPLAHEALQIDLTAGLMMPCNVVVYETDGGRAGVVAVDPAQATAGQPQLTGVAERVRTKLQRVLERLE
jgi:uncharacterized protein (DUF302 family)